MTEYEIARMKRLEDLEKEVGRWKHLATSCQFSEVVEALDSIEQMVKQELNNQYIVWARHERKNS